MLQQHHIGGKISGRSAVLWLGSETTTAANPRKGYFMSDIEKAGNADAEKQTEKLTEADFEGHKLFGGEKQTEKLTEADFEGHKLFGGEKQTEKLTEG
jgi:hypothetical protein